MIKDTQYALEDILNQAQKGIITIGNKNWHWNYFVKFFAKTNKNSKVKGGLVLPNDCPIMEIPNYDLFVKELDEYIKVATEFYKDDLIYYGYEDENEQFIAQGLILYLFETCTVSDLTNMNKFVRKRTNMLKSKITESQQLLGTYEGAEIWATIIKNDIIRDTPYRFIVSLKDGNDVFNLPSINFGIDGDVIHIYGTQKLVKAIHKGKDPATLDMQFRNENNALVKKFDRFFRKVNKDIDPDSIIANITPNALVAFTCFSSFMQDNGLTKVVAPDYMPIRYNGYVETGKHKYNAGKVDENFMDDINRNQFNMTNKFMYLLLRYSEHFCHTKCSYDEDMSQMKMVLESKIYMRNGNIIQDIADATCKTKFWE